MLDRMAGPRTYPNGVPSWIEVAEPDIEAAKRFYGELFGWTFETVSPTGDYTIAWLDGREVAGLSAGPAGWHTYVAVDDADASAAAVSRAGGRVLSEPAAPGPAGRAAGCADPAGAEFRLWQAGRRLGVQAANEPGAWNFSNLHTPDPAGATEFYSTVFGWVIDDVGFGMMVRVPGYGDHLASTVDPDIKSRQDEVGAPPGFADAVAWLVPVDAGEPAHWHVAFTVADRDGAVGTVERRGGAVISTEDSDWTRYAVVRDPWGATFTVSQFTPPENS
jgi:hypothetical protein